jgi:uncharacterized membrane protein YfcA
MEHIWNILVENIDSIGLYILVGFVAQMVDGALGMAYGVLSSSFLLSFGVSPAAASASIHIAEIFTTGVSGISHMRAKNINKPLLKKLLIPGMVGGLLGAITISVLDSKALKPYIALFLLLMGIRILVKAIRFNKQKTDIEADPEAAAKRKWIAPLAVLGGFFDASGGGGWGPIVTSTLLANGDHPRKTIGTVNTAEFFVTVVQVIIFISLLKLTSWAVILGLMIGGVIAAPLGANLVRKVPTRVMMYIVGCLICFLQIRTIYLAWF